MDRASGDQEEFGEPLAGLLGLLDAGWMTIRMIHLILFGFSGIVPFYSFS